MKRTFKERDRKLYAKDRDKYTDIQAKIRAERYLLNRCYVEMNILIQHVYKGSHLLLIID